MSALPLKADVLSLGIYVCFVPEADYSGRCRRSDRPKSFCETLLKDFRNEQAKPLPDHRAYDRDLRSLRVLGV